LYLQTVAIQFAGPDVVANILIVMSLIFDVRVDVLHHDLEAIEAVSFCGRDLVGETFFQVFIDNTVRGSEDRGSHWRNIQPHFC
jgi:hypothetical protein